MAPRQPLRKNAAGVPVWWPSAVAVWSSPTLDATRDTLYIIFGVK